MLRSWQALPDFFTDTIALPDVHYRVIDFSGNDSDVVAVTPDAQNSSLATITANQAGTAVVLVTYDAALSAKANGTASRYSAIWPENTGVLVVSVGADGTGLTTNMTLNDGLTNYSRHEKNAGYAIDAEQDVLYYTGSEGASYTFTPPAGSTVSVAKAALTGESLTYNGFADVPANADGSVTLTGLTTGSHIVKVEQGGTATYQVIRAKQTTLTLTHEDGSAITAENPVYPGDTVLVSFGALYKGNYISAVNGLAEFANGTYSGWMYTLNGSYPLQGVEEQQVRDGDVIVFHYTDDYRVERTGYTSDTSGAEKVIQLIDKIGTVTLNSKDAIRAARKAYEGLSAAEKEKVTNYKTLTAAESRLSQLQIQGAINKISLIGTVTLNSGSKLDTAWNAYNALTAEQKLKVTNRGTLSQAQETYNALKAEETEKFIDEIDDVITLESEEDIVKARKAYDALSKTQQGLVDKEYLDKLKAAEQALAALKASEDDRKEAQQVIQLIDQLGTITLDSEKDVEAARAAYEKLTDIQKALVTNYEKLVAAEAALESKKTFAVFEDAYITTGDYMESLGVPGVGSIGGEWMVIGLARSGRTVPEGFYDNVLSFVEENIDENQRIHQAKSTENSRLILALTAIGKDVTNVGGHDLLEGLKEMEYVSYQGLNGTIWALIAFDCGNYPVPEDGDVTREALVQTILDAQLADGGWALVGEEADADMTGMALQSLAPYYGSSEAVKLAVDSAVETLSLMQNADGSFPD